MQQEPIWIPVGRENCRNSSELWDVISRKYFLDYNYNIKCKLCLQNDIGDEYHNLFRCDLLFTLKTIVSK